MIAILAIFCSSAFLHVQCAPKSNEYEPTVESWWLKEVFIKSKSTHEPMEHYARKSRLVRYDNGLRLDTLKTGDDEAIKIYACFKVNELYAFLHDDLYAITQHPRQVIRMTLATLDEARLLKKFFEPTPLERTFEVSRRYYMSGLIVSDGLARLSHKDDDASDSAPITLTVYVGLDRLGHETEDRRFMISGGNQEKLFAVFNRDEFSFIRKGSNGRVILIVHPPGNFWGKLFYSMKMSFSRDGALNEFIEEMSRHTSVNAATRTASTSLAPYL